MADSKGSSAAATAATSTPANPETAAERDARVAASIKAGFAPLKPQYLIPTESNSRAWNSAPVSAATAAAAAASVALAVTPKPAATSLPVAAAAAPKAVAAAAVAAATGGAAVAMDTASDHKQPRVAAPAAAAVAAATPAPKSNISFRTAPVSNVSFRKVPDVTAVATAAAAAGAAAASSADNKKRPRDDAAGTAASAAATASPTADNSTTAGVVAGAAAAAGGEQPQTKKQRKRGQNKNRETFKSQKSGESTCFALLVGEECKHGSACTFSHDIDAYLASKPADLGSRCYIFDILGKCRAGFCCRFAGAHLTHSTDAATGVRTHTLVTETRDAATRAKMPNEINEYSKELTKKLSRNRYTFKLSDTLKAGSEEYKAFCAKYEGKKMTCDLVPKTTTATATAAAAGDSKAAASASSSSVAAATAAVPASAIGTPSDDAARLERAKRAFIMSSAKEDEAVGCLIPLERRPIDFKDKLYLAPLTTCGNLPFRRVCKELGADITCGEMAMCTNIARGHQPEWALMKRHPSEKLFGIQICGGHVDNVAAACELINEQFVSTGGVDFVDLNVGCPIDLVCNKGLGCMLMQRHKRLQGLLRTMTSVLDCPATMKMRTGWNETTLNSIDLLPMIKHSGIAAVTLHGRTRKQRYSKLADWEWIKKCAASTDLPLIGNGDIYTYTDYYEHMEKTNATTCMIARGALIKPWLFTEIKERRHWDISSTERFEMLKTFTNYGLEHWGSDSRGVDITRNFLLEWISFLYRYIPIGCLETANARMNWKSHKFMGRNELETLMASNNSADWVKLTEMLLGPVPAGYTFTPKHRSNAYENDAPMEGNG